MGKPDQYGWERTIAMQHTEHGKRKFCFVKPTNNPDIKMWISPSETIKGIYLVEKSTHLGNYKFENKIVCQFDKAVDAKKWVNQEYAHMFEGL